MPSTALSFLIGFLPTLTSAAWMLTIPPYEEACFLLHIPTHRWTKSRQLFDSLELIDDSENILDSVVESSAIVVLTYV
jgi:hypothetical protein